MSVCAGEGGCSKALFCSGEKYFEQQRKIFFFSHSVIFLGENLYLYPQIKIMEQKFKFSPNVMLVDAVHLDRVGRDIAAHFEPLVKRKLPEADLATLLECLSLDAGILPGENEMQVIFVYELGHEQMKFCSPAHLEREIHGMAFRGSTGEFSLYAFQPSGMATREALFAEALQLAGEDKNVKRILFAPDEAADVTALEKVIREIKGKDALTMFGMNPPEQAYPCRFEWLGFAVLQALGIRSEELE